MSNEPNDKQTIEIVGAPTGDAAALPYRTGGQ